MFSNVFAISYRNNVRLIDIMFVLFIKTMKLIHSKNDIIFMKISRTNNGSAYSYQTRI